MSRLTLPAADPVATHPLSRLTTGTISPDGVDLVIYSAGVDLPETGHCSYDVALHDDGASCSPECGCVDAEARTTIWEGATITRGEWTWHADRYVLVGLRSTGPSRPELRERVEYLTEALADERELHHDAKLQLHDDSRLIDRLRGELGESAQALETLRAARETAVAARDRAESWVLRLTIGGVAAVLVLAVALVWAVIA